MEGMNLEIIDMIHQLQYLAEYRKSKETGKAGKDGYGYPFEPFEAFSDEPLNFTETAMRLHTEALELFNLAGTANRHSPLYYRMSGQLEKLIGQLGGCCITKAVLEQQGNEFDLLEDLTIDTLRRMTAHNFRKAWSSFMESRAANNYNGTALDLSIRWAALDKRLLATEEKIKKIRSGEIKIDTAVKNTKAENKKQAETAPEKEASTRSFDSQGRAFHVDKAAVREAQGQTAETPAEAPCSAGPEITEEQPGAADILPEAESAPEENPTFAEAPVFEPKPFDVFDEDGDEDEENDPDIWPFPIRSDILFKQDRDLYRVDTSALPYLIREKGPPV